MRYLICQDFDNTHGNHAGMVHMCNLLKEKYPSEYKVIISKCFNLQLKQSNNIFKKIHNTIFLKILQFFYILPTRIYTSVHLLLKANKNDTIYLLEYMFPSVNQRIIAIILKKTNPKIRIIGLSHLTPSLLKTMMSENEIRKWAISVDYIMTLGSSLTNFYVSCGIKREKIITAFHYVDLDYYFQRQNKLHRPITIICMGGLQRDFKLLSNIVKSIHNVHWIICKGRKNLDNYFKNCENISLIDYVKEDELKKLMSESDISLNIMSDTVGSNVITTSIAMGLIMVVSDVGSIRDYCKDEFSIFCDNKINSFVEALSKLINKDNEILYNMKSLSYNNSVKYSIGNFHKLLCSIDKIKTIQI